MRLILLIGGIVAALVVVALIVDRVLLWAERRGWVFYRRRKGRGAVNLGLLDQIYQPAMEHVIEQETHEESLSDTVESGEPEAPGS